MTLCGMNGQTSAPSAVTSFTLSADQYGLVVEVTIRGVGERWIATALIESRREVGIARTPGGALNAALASLDSAARTVLLADLALLRPSCEILKALPAGA